MQVDNYQFEARPEGHLLMYSNDDKPGVLGAVSTILGQADINIGDFNMGRNKKTAVALRCVIAIRCRFLAVIASRACGNLRLQPRCSTK
jgi:D-3-phosphoglycerate dehydrogenase